MCTAPVIYPDWSPAMSMSITVSHSAAQVAGRSYKVVPTVATRSCYRTVISTFILVINQLDAQNLFYNKFISSLYVFRAPCAHRQGVKSLLYSI